MTDEYSFRKQSDDIIRNLDDRAQEIKEVSRQIKRAREILRSEEMRNKKERARPFPVPSKLVFKKVLQGKKGGLYYINRSGKRVYLNASQCKRCVAGSYPVRVKKADDRKTNAVLGCPPTEPEKVKCRRSRGDLKRKIRELEKFINESC